MLAGIAVAGSLVPLPRAEIALFGLLILALLPAFGGGLVEDVTRRVSPGVRLLLTAVTASLAFSLAGVRLARSDMAWLDGLLAFLPFSYMALLLAVAGVAHSVNLIDGYNGLAGGVTMIVLSALGVVGYRQGDLFVAAFCLIPAAATLGFLVLNWPRGKIFLGDGGAYVLGCIIALGAALLIMRNPGVSPWFAFALVVYPVWETLFSILRRVLIYRTHIGEPDARHLHSLVYRRLSWRWTGGRRKGHKAWRNSLTPVPFWVVNAGLACFAVAWCDDTRMQQLIAVLFVLGYCLAYWRLARLARPAAGMGERLRSRSVPGDSAMENEPDSAK
ncbi:MAG TPA: glycosyltransferase [Verrucomicrobiae bacterium]|nr:glycosyltransferase [Verrucomicrobiae bacterium]